MQKVTLTAVYHNDKDRNGNPYKSKTGKPYTKCNIKTTEYGDKYISGFGNRDTEKWNAGDTVEIEIEQRGEYLNFSLPKKDIINNESLLRIEKKLDNALFYLVGISNNLRDGKPIYPTPEMEGIDIAKTGTVPNDLPDINPEDVPF